MGTYYFGASRPDAVPVDLPGEVQPRRLAVLGRACAVIVVVLGLVGLAGWVFGVEALKHAGPGLPAIRINSAVSLVLLGTSWLAPRGVRVICLAVVALLAATTLFEYATTLDLGIDQLFAKDRTGQGYPGRMSIVSCLVFIALAAGRALVDARRWRWAQACALAAVLLATLVLLGYAYGLPLLSTVKHVSTVAVQSALGAVLLGAALFVEVPDGIVRRSIGDDAAAILTRRLVPVALVGLPLSGFLALLGRRAGWYATSTTVALAVVSSVLVIGVFTWTAIKAVSRAERTRAAAIEELTALRDDLEEQVGERAEQLRSRHEQIALLEDRQRIAADLHDIVIQRLFAAGLFLQGSKTLAADADGRARVDAVVEAMDAAIMDLRASIFELGGHATGRLDLLSALDEVCRDSARVLGFLPDLIVDDPDGDAEDARDDLLAVTREALANVARHAQASSAVVELRSAAGAVTLMIADDGRGMAVTSRRSGTRNMNERARQRGGDCVWSPVQPHGTRVMWRITVRAQVSQAAPLGFPAARRSVGA